jgi:hypothetical protein
VITIQDDFVIINVCQDIHLKEELLMFSEEKKQWCFEEEDSSDELWS